VLVPVPGHCALFFIPALVIKTMFAMVPVAGHHVVNGANDTTLTFMDDNESLRSILLAKKRIGIFLLRISKKEME
jgi:hypothetical protein